MSEVIDQKSKHTTDQVVGTKNQLSAAQVLAGKLKIEHPAVAHNLNHLLLSNSLHLPHATHVFPQLAITYHVLNLNHHPHPS